VFDLGNNSSRNKNKFNAEINEIQKKILKIVKMYGGYYFEKDY
jgi:hypothetical protein